MPKKGKKNRAPLLVAPEPLGDELETDIMWDYVKEVNDKPSFMDGTFVEATRGAFEVDKNDKNTAESVKNTFTDATRCLAGPRACEMFEKAELELKKSKEYTEYLREENAGFQLLKQSEEDERKLQRNAANEAVRCFLVELSDERHEVLENMENEADKFLQEVGQIMESICSLGAVDAQIEAAFDEQQRMREECRLSEEKYFRNKGDHVEHMRHMREKTRSKQREMITSMVTRLEGGVDEMTKTSDEEVEDISALEEERSHLLADLVKYQAQSAALEKKTSVVSYTRAEIQREIALELQKHKMCMERQNHLQKELKTLAEIAKENNLKISEANSTVNSTAAYAKVLPMVPASPNTIADLNVLGEEKSLSLLTVEVKRDLELATLELTDAQNTYWALRRQHLLQLSGKHQSDNLENFFQKADSCFLDAETSAAIRSVVVDSTLEVSESVNELDSVEKPDGNLDRLLSVTDLQERKAIQDLVVKRINKLFSRACPTAPPHLSFPEVSDVQPSM